MAEGYMGLGAFGKFFEPLNLENAGPVKRILLEHDFIAIGEYVLADSRISRELAVSVAAICRRRFKATDIVVLDILDEKEEGEAGIAFTEKGIYCWEEDETFVAEILYSNIAAVDYEEEYVIITDKEGKEIRLFCGDEDEVKYSRNMYNYIMDIKEAMEAQ